MLWLYRIGILLAVCTGIYIVISAAGGRQKEPVLLPEELTISCSAAKDKIPLGQDAQLTVELVPEDTQAELTYESSNPDVLTVDENGVVHGVSFGAATVTVTATAKDGTELTKKTKLRTSLPTPANLTVTCAQDTSLDAQLRWDEVEGARGYQVYRLTDEGKWKCLTDEPLTETGFTDTRTLVQADNTYVVIALAESARNNSGFQNEVTMTIPQAPYGTKISSITDDGIEYYWKKPSDIGGYQVFRAYEKDGDYTMVEDIPTRKINTYLDETFDQSQKRVYYKVRSYQVDANGNKVFSELSDSSRAQFRDKLTLDNHQAFVRSGATHTIDAYIGWGYASDVVWESSDEKVATVSDSGVVTGVSAGEAVISCTQDNGKKHRTVRRCTVIVDRQPQSKLKNRQMRYTQDEEGTWNSLEDTNSQTAKIVMAGDMMCTGSQQAAQGYDTGDYNFNESYDEVRSLISDSDLAIGNLETSLSSTWPYMHESAYIDNYPNCNGPSRYLDAVAYAGFDAVVMANNHNCDAEVQGLQETIEQVDRYGFARTGVFEDAEAQRYLLLNVNGIKVAYLSYVSQETGFNGKEEEWAQEDVDTHLNYYEPKKVEQDIKDAREAGAEYVIAFMHWGVKNVQSITNDQKTTAKELANLGVDYIVGSHCHLVQEYTVLRTEDGRSVPCMYSLGDFQASITQIPGNRASALLQLELTRGQDGTIQITDEYYIPCFTLTNYKGKAYCTIPTNRVEKNGRHTLRGYNKIHTRTVESIGEKLREDKTAY